MRIFYRISDNSYPKIKLPGTDKKSCLYNFAACFPDENLTVIADNCLSATLKMVREVTRRESSWVLETSLSNAGALSFAIDLAMNLPDEEIIYFVEDDYLHFQGQAFGDRNPARIIEEGFQVGQYVTLFDHPDKYQLEYNMGETSQVFRTRSTHWRHTISTCMTFATKVKQLRSDIEIWNKYIGGNHPHDHQIFCELRAKKGVCVASSIPGHAFHTDLTYQIQKSMISSTEISSMIEPWAVEIAEKALRTEIGESVPGEFIDDSYRRLMMLDAMAKIKKARQSGPSN